MSVACSSFRLADALEGRDVALDGRCDGSLARRTTPST